MILSLPWPPSHLNPNSRVHWARKAKFRKEHKHDCMWIVKAAPKPGNLDGKISLLIRFRPPDNRRRDLDNMLASMKAGIDGIAEAWGVDDSHFMLTLDIGPIVKHGAVEVEFA